MNTKNNLKNMLKDRRCIKIVGAHNGLTAKLVEEAGFDGVWSSGFEISTSHAVPDANILTMTDFLDTAMEMVNTVSIPVIADCDTGFGNSNNVIHMVQNFESAGIDAVCIEDKKFPKVNSFIAGRQELAPIGEFVGKIMAAKNAQRTKNFMVFARVEALIAGWGMQEALRRAESYVDAGADGIFIHSKESTPKEILDFCSIWKRRSPVLVSPTTYQISEQDMKDCGINVVIYANQGIRAAIKHTREVFSHMKKHGVNDIDSKIAPMNDVFQLQGMHIMKQNEKQYLKSDAGSTKAIILAAGSKMDDSLIPLLEDRPVGMLDIGGKSLIKRNMETLNAVGVQDINVVIGYKGEQIVSDDAKVIKNRQFKTKGIMYSVIKGMDSIADKNLIIYSDILLDQYLLSKLIRNDDAIVVVVDSTYKKTHFRNKKLELVKAKYPPADSPRTIDTNRKNTVVKIGSRLSEREANFEFIGVAQLSKNGMEILKKEYRNFKSADNISFADFIQHLIKKGHEVVAHEVNSGWMEVHNFNDYKMACSLFT